MRIDVVVVITGLDADSLAHRRQIVQDYASPGTEVRLVVTGDGPASVESQAELEMAAPGILRRVVESQASGADGIVIWGGHDPSLSAARELVDIPVVAPGMASMYLVSSLVRRFSLLVQLPNVLGVAEGQVTRLGLESRCASIRSVDVPVLELSDNSAFQAIHREAIRAIDEDGADGICFGCMAMTPHAMQLQTLLDDERPGAIVIDPGYAAIRWLEMMIGMGLTHSRRSYRSVPKPLSFDMPKQR